MPLTLTAIPGIPVIQPGDDLASIIKKALDLASISLEDGDILVIAQKIVSKAEGRLVNLREVKPSIQAYELAEQVEKDPRIVELILNESRQVLRTRPGVMIVEHRLGFICASAGIDHSNVGIPQGRQVIARNEAIQAASPQIASHSTLAMTSGRIEEATESDDWVLLLPENPDASAHALRKNLEESSKKRLGVLIIDSHGRAWRLGTVGVAIGLSGMPALVDMRGWRDMFGVELQITQVGSADELASAASILMGQASEGTPVVHVRGFPHPLREGSLGELLRPAEQDLFR